jgi:hypothetical protein
VLATSCALEPGQGFATLERATVELAFEPGKARDLGEDGFLTDRSYRVRLEHASVHVDSLSLEEITGGTGGTFDPANPPPGFSLCHGGHCHADDGRLVSYAEVEAELSGGASAFRAVATTSLEARADLLTPTPLQALVFEPSRELPRSDLRRLVLALGALELEGTIDHADLPLPLALDVRLPLGSLGADLDVSIGRDGPERLEVRAAASFDGTLLDGLELAALAVDGRVTLHAPDEPAALSVQNAAARTPLTPHVLER